MMERAKSRSPSSAAACRPPAILGLTSGARSDWDDARALLAGPLVIGGATDPSELSAAIDDAGFRGAAGSDLGGKDLNVRVRAIQFDSEEGALEARDLLHDEDLKSPCADACIVTPIEYELNDVPDSAAVHHVPTRGDLPPGQSGVEAHHAEFVIGPRLYVVQVDGRPSPSLQCRLRRADGDRLRVGVER